MKTLFDLPAIEEKEAPKKAKFAIQVSDFEGNSYLIKKESHADYVRWYVLESDSRKKPSTWASLNVAIRNREDMLRVLPAKYDKATAKVVQL